MPTERSCFGSIFSPSRSRQGTVPGLILVEDAFTEEQETALLRAVDESPVRWNRRRTRITKNYGPYYFFSERDTPQGRFRYTDGKIIHTPLPPFLNTLVMPIILHAIPSMESFKPNQLHVALYRKGEDGKIRMHNDNKMGELGPFIVGMCLNSGCIMTFMHPKTGKKKLVNLPRRSIYVMTGESHHEWRHGILSGDTERDRISFTLREVRSLNVEEGAKVVRSSHMPSERALVLQQQKDDRRRRGEGDGLEGIRLVVQGADGSPVASDHP